MAINAQKIKLNIVPGGIIPIINVSQNDIGRVLQFELYDGLSAASITAGTTATIEGTKPDNHAFQYDATITGNVVTVNTVQQMVIVPGTVECTLTLTYSGQVIGTALFFMEVERSGIADNTDISETVLPVYMEAGRQYMLGSEAWAVGTKNGEPVGSVEPQYNNYSKYYADRAHEDAVISGSAMLIAGQSAESARESAVISGSAMRIAGQSAATAQSAAADALGYKSQASESAAQAAASAIQSAASAATSADAEAWAVGERAGQPVDPGDPTFHNNAKYYAGQAEDAVEYGIVDMVGATNTTNGSHGAAVQPVAGQQNHYLKGDGTWSREDMTVTEITDSAPYFYRASKGGDRQYDELIGGSVVWNQQIPLDASWWDTYVTRMTVATNSDNGFTVTKTGTTSQTSGINHVLKEGHVYYVRGQFKVSDATGACMVAIRKNNATFNADNALVYKITQSTTYEPFEILAKTTDTYYCLGVYRNLATPQNDTADIKDFVCFDLTAMFGNTIADYINAKEIAETGSGIAWIKSYGFFSKDYYSSDSGSILSVNTSGHKLIKNFIPYPFSDFTPSVNNRVSYRDNGDGTITAKRTGSSSSGSYAGIMDRWLPPGTYTLTGCPSGGGSNFYLGAYKDTLAGIARVAKDEGSGATFTVDSSFTTVRIAIWVKNTYNIDKVFKPILTDDTGAVYTYPLTSTDLRGILSLSGDDLVYDGDVYESDGTETVKYALLSNQTGAIGDTITLTGYKTSGKIICDKGLISDIGTISGTTLTLTAAITSASFVYELATPTTATLSPFVSPQICDKDGTEAYIDTRAVPMPVGHYTEYYGVPEWLRDRYLDELRAYPYNPTLPVNPTTENIANFKNGSMWVKNANLFVKMADIIHRIPTEPITLVFSSDEAFTLSVATPGWDGTIEYFIDGVNWAIWDGSELSGTATQPIYLRGTGNTEITGSLNHSWTFTGKYCTGNIETLLDYQTVARGQHPSMGDYCYYSMFNTCTSLIVAPELPATILAKNCYALMFAICTSLTTAPQLPATKLAEKCYSGMFQSCISLTTAPQLPATILAKNCYSSMFANCTLTNPPELPAITLADYCYYDMFNGCRSLTMLPELPATILTTYCYKNMFKGCTSIKLSTSKVDAYQYEYRIPILNTGTDATDALTDMFTNTGGTFTGTPTINTTYYTDHKPV